MKESQPAILLVEDDEGHAVLLQSSLRRAGFSHPIIRCRDGQEALDYLFPDGGTVPRPAGPLTVLMDIRMPKVDGIEVLRRIRERSELNSMPVIMVTTTDDPREVALCRSLGATAHLTKRPSRAEFAGALQSLAHFFAGASPAHDSPPAQS